MRRAWDMGIVCLSGFWDVHSAWLGSRLWRIGTDEYHIHSDVCDIGLERHPYERRE